MRLRTLIEYEEQGCYQINTNDHILASYIPHKLKADRLHIMAMTQALGKTTSVLDNGVTVFRQGKKADQLQSIVQEFLNV